MHCMPHLLMCLQKVLFKGGDSMKTIRWRAVNKAQNREEYKAAIKEAHRRKAEFLADNK